MTSFLQRFHETLLSVEGRQTGGRRRGRATAVEEEVVGTTVHGSFHHGMSWLSLALRGESARRSAHNRPRRGVQKALGCMHSTERGTEGRGLYCITHCAALWAGMWLFHGRGGQFGLFRALRRNFAGANHTQKPPPHTLPLSCACARWRTLHIGCTKVYLPRSTTRAPVLLFKSGAGMCLGGHIG